MQISSIVSCLVVLATARANIAPKATNNPKNVIAVADFPELGPNEFTKGYVFFTSPGGNEVKVHIDFTGLPKVGGPFFYHIHKNPVNTNTCEHAGSEFDPYDGMKECPLVGDNATCMVGDLSGKHGWINTTCYQHEYTDQFISLNSKDASYIVGRSLVLHTVDQERFACANINIATKEQYKVLFDTVPDAMTPNQEATVDKQPDSNAQPGKVVPSAPNAKSEDAKKDSTAPSQNKGPSMVPSDNGSHLSPALVMSTGMILLAFYIMM